MKRYILWKRTPLSRILHEYNAFSKNTVNSGGKRTVNPIIILRRRGIKAVKIVFPHLLSLEIFWAIICMIVQIPPKKVHRHEQKSVLQHISENSENPKKNIWKMTPKSKCGANLQSRMVDLPLWGSYHWEGTILGGGLLRNSTQKACPRERPKNRWKRAISGNEQKLYQKCQKITSLGGIFIVFRGVYLWMFPKKWRWGSYLWGSTFFAHSWRGEGASHFRGSFLGGVQKKNAITKNTCNFPRFWITQKKNLKVCKLHIPSLRIRGETILILGRWIFLASIKKNQRWSSRHSRPPKKKGIWDEAE